MVVSIRAENLAASCGNVKVWDGLSIKLSEPGPIGILGPNGVGKSTFMYMINKLMFPAKGHMYIDETPRFFVPSYVWFSFRCCIVS